MPSPSPPKRTPSNPLSGEPPSPPPKTPTPETPQPYKPWRRSQTAYIPNPRVAYAPTDLSVQASIARLLALPPAPHTRPSYFALAISRAIEAIGAADFDVESPRVQEQDGKPALRPDCEFAVYAEDGGVPRAVMRWLLAEEADMVLEVEEEAYVNVKWAAGVWGEDQSGAEDWFIHVDERER